MAKIGGIMLRWFLLVVLSFSLLGCIETSADSSKSQEVTTRIYWTRLNDLNLYRTRTPNGWLVYNHAHGDLVYIPDADSKWALIEVEGK